MAVVSKSDIGLPNGQRFTRIVKYGKVSTGYSRSKTQIGKFWVELPEEVRVWNDNKNELADTEDLAITAFKDKIEMYYSSVTKKEKLLLLKIDITARIVKPGCETYALHSDDDKYFIVNSNFSRHSEGKSHEVSVGWGVYERVAIGNKVQYTWLKIGTNVKEYHINEDSFNHYGIKKVAWTEEREKWFVSMQQSFDAMIIKLDKFLKEIDDKKFTALVDSKKLLLTQ